MSRTLTNAFRRFFASPVERKGESYFLWGAVKQLEGDKGHAFAVVRGAGDYQVALRWKAITLQASCSCPFFDSNGLCKHIWAALRACEERNILLPRPLGQVNIVAQDGMPHETHAPAARGHGGDLEQWKLTLSRVTAMEQSTSPTAVTSAEERSIHYVMSLPVSKKAGADCLLSALTRTRKKNGTWNKGKPVTLDEKELARIADPLDRRILTLLSGSKIAWENNWRQRDEFSERIIPPVLCGVLLPDLCATGRFTLQRGDIESAPLRLDDGAPWKFELQVTPADSNYYRIWGRLTRDNESVDLADPVLFLPAGWIFWPDHIARLDDGGGYPWIQALRQDGHLIVPRKSGGELVDRLAGRKSTHPVSLPDELAWTEVDGKPTPVATVSSNARHSIMLDGRTDFRYGDKLVAPQQAGRVVETGPRSFIRRDLDAERLAMSEFEQAGFFHKTHALEPGEPPCEIIASRLPAAARFLLGKGWSVKAEGKAYRQPGAFKLNVTTGVDWFELHGGVEFDGKAVPLPALLDALKREQGYVTLDDGTLGLLPEDWLKKFGGIAAFGESEKDHVRFKKSQAGLLDILLAAQPEISFDTAFGRLREELNSFEHIKSAAAPDGFIGTLRDYQRDGLGWLHFLQKFQFGGCLADDMGLGKTVQVLALLESRRELRHKPKSEVPPSLVVVPKSLIFNWMREAERFAPKLRMLDHTGIARAKSTGHLLDYDIILTTYGTLRRDAALLKDMEFDYLILDEAQAIKNPDSQSAKATRLLKGRHRLAMSGTPIENHIGELWSLFEFINPGMLGTLRAFEGLTKQDDHVDARALLARSLRPFILRRTKSQVAKDLPERQEETVYCELPTEQRKLYNQLRDHYRSLLLGIVDEQGMAKSKMHILEGLLRLRQAACHPGLIDAKSAGDESAKLSVLIPQLSEIASEGHKTLVFSQFVSFLTIVRTALKDTGIRYAYLDGKTRDREARVKEFQDDPDCKLFLISLKAGGLGLNLTSAEYVYLLDPWWNPAVEAQAIDRAHRIGQKQKVFAYRLIARDTIEEKVLELQKKKRDLADAIINAENSLIRSITRDDLQLLLS